MAATAMDDPPDSLSATASPLSEDTTTTTIIAASFDPTLLTEYVADLAVVALNASREDLRLSLLSYPDTLQRCSRFAADPNNLVLYLRKETGDTNSQIGIVPPFQMCVDDFQGMAKRRLFIISVLNTLLALQQSHPLP
jgi:hypothetical protein